MGNQTIPTAYVSTADETWDIAEQIKVTGSSELHILDATLYNIIGQSITQLVFNSEKISQTTHVNSGVYIVQLNTPNGFINRKVIIK